MQETGKVVFIGATQSGVNPRTGNQWQSVEFVIETNERYPRKIAFTLFGQEKIELARLQLGETIEIVGYAESHEYNGNWYSELRCTDICQHGISRLIRPLFPNQQQKTEAQA